MIISFSNQAALTAWLAGTPLPSKIIAYLMDTNKYVVHTNNTTAGDITYAKTLGEYQSSGVLPIEVLQEIEIFDYNLNPPEPEGGTYTKEEVNDKLETLKWEIMDDVIWNYATRGEVDVLEADVEEMKDNLENNYATKEEIPSLDGYATESYVDEKIGDVADTLQTILGDE